MNITKTNFVIFQANNKPKILITILINKRAIDEVKYVKYLGVLIDSQLSFNYHIAELSKKVSRAIGVLYKLRPYVTTKILINVYYAIVYPFLLYGIAVWGNVTKNLIIITPIHILQKKIVRMVTYNDGYNTVFGPLVHTPPLFHELRLLNIFDIFKLQVGKFVFESVKGIGPSQSIVNYTRASDVHDHDTRYANQGNFFIMNVRTSKYGAKGLNRVGSKLWATIPNHIKACVSRKSFNVCYKKFLIESYSENS